MRSGFSVGKFSFRPNKFVFSLPTHSYPSASFRLTPLPLCCIHSQGLAYTTKAKYTFYWDKVSFPNTGYFKNSSLILFKVSSKGKAW